MFPLIIGDLLEIPRMFLIVWCAVIVPFLVYGVRVQKKQEKFWQTVLEDIEKIRPY